MLSEMEILKMNVGGRTVLEMGALEFLQWVAAKCNNLQGQSADAVRLQLKVKNVPFGRFMSEFEKIETVRTMERLEIPLP